MSDLTATLDSAPGAVVRPRLDAKPHVATLAIFLILLVIGLGFVINGLVTDISPTAASSPIATGAFVLLGLALLIALGFEFVNGFHDTANAVATVIYTHSLPAPIAVVWSGCWNLVGVLLSSGAVAFTVVSLLPVELILQVGSGAGFAMIFALLIAAILWNLGTWWLGLPASSSHTMIGSIIGVGLANQLLSPAGSATSGVDWSQAAGVFRALLFSPVIGFALSAVLLLVMKQVVRVKSLYAAPDGTKPPPLLIRGLLILTCTSVSFAHGSNDGQKGMGLIMLILIGAAPTAYALNHAMPPSSTPGFLAATQAAAGVFNAHAGGTTMPVPQALDQAADAIKLRKVDGQATWGALGVLANDIGAQVRKDGSVSQVPAAAVQNVRNEMYLTSEAIRIASKQGSLTQDEVKTLGSYKSGLDASTRFIPTWVKVAVAVALGLGTMIGWKRIVVTVGEKIGKAHLTYAQGASAELVAAATIGLADMYGLPVSTTHVLSSGVAGTMAASGSGLQWSTVRNMAMAWVLTLPAAMLMSGVLYAILRQVF
jgi:PiT family inorganic phosphate transporter